MQNEFTTALACDRWCSYSIRCPSSRGLCRLQVDKQSCTFLLGIALLPHLCWIWFNSNFVFLVADRGLQRQRATSRNMGTMTTGSTLALVVDHQLMTIARPATTRGSSSQQLKDEWIQKGSYCRRITEETMVLWTTLCPWQVGSVIVSQVLKVAEIVLWRLFLLIFLHYNYLSTNCLCRAPLTRHVPRSAVLFTGPTRCLFSDSTRQQSADTDEYSVSDDGKWAARPSGSTVSETVP